MKIPFLDIQSHHAPMLEEILGAIRQVIVSGDLAGGSFVEEFEKDFAAYCGTKHAVGVGSGTDALWLTLKAMGIGPGDEVITVPMTFFATAEAITMTGARPVFVDVDSKTFTMDPSAIEGAVTSRTKAIIPVHLFGQTAAMEPINQIARRFALRVIEDASQAHGAGYQGRKAGSLADAGCFSFYPAKNLGAVGEGGAVTTNDGALAEELRCLRNHGQSVKNHHHVVGWNSRMDGIQGAVLKVKLGYLDDSNALRRRHALQYTVELASSQGVMTPMEGENMTHVYHIYALQATERMRLVEAFREKGIGYGLHYPVPIHLQPAYRGLGYLKGAFPVTERCADQLISLPMFPELNASQIDAVVKIVKGVGFSCKAA